MLSIVLVLGWIFVVGLLAIGMLVLSIGGDGWIGLLPFSGCALVALFQRALSRLTVLGASCVALTAIPVAFGTGLAIANVHHGHGYVTFLIAMLVAVLVTVVDGADRLTRRAARRACVLPD